MQSTIISLTIDITFSRFGAMASSSSMKIMAGAFFSASSKALRKLLSDSPASLLMISGPVQRTTSTRSLALKYFKYDRVGVEDVAMIRQLHHYQTTTQVLSSPLQAALDYLPLGTGYDDIEVKQRGTVLISEYLQLLLWCLTSGLLPERKECDHDKPRFALPLLCHGNLYEDLCRAASGSGVSLLIDGLLVQHGSGLTRTWPTSSSLHCPPLYIYSLIGCYLSSDVPITCKHQLLLYLLCDLYFMSDENAGEREFDNISEDFPSVFSESEGLSGHKNF
jgi:hypothetical protein